jgi:hypothetical protein
MSRPQQSLTGMERDTCESAVTEAGGKPAPLLRSSKQKAFAAALTREDLGRIFAAQRGPRLSIKAE